MASAVRYLTALSKWPGLAVRAATDIPSVTMRPNRTRPLFLAALAAFPLALIGCAEWRIEPVDEEAVPGEPEAPALAADQDTLWEDEDPGEPPDRGGARK